ncbi:MAG: hypothetical protein M8467_18045 [Anaerolineae bacterium]|nr:hypothetical protein [Anaerolineae bacterium]
MAIAFCPDCEEPIQLGERPKVGQRVTCRSCGAELEVIEVSPLELDWAFEGPIDDWQEDEEAEDEDEGWDDEEDWDDEDEWEEDEEWEDEGG